MRIRVLAVLAAMVCAVGLPQSAAAQTASSPSQHWKDQVYNMILSTATGPICQKMGYKFDAEDAQAGFAKKIADAPKSGVSPDEAAVYIVEQMKVINPRAAATEAGLKSPDAKVAAQTLRNVFNGNTGAVCSDLARLSYYVYPGPFQTSGRSQTYENFVAFQAETAAR